jgi:energy-converting hydrogenase Eha subunit C
VKKSEEVPADDQGGMTSAFKYGMIGGVIFVVATTYFDQNLTASLIDLVACHAIVLLLAMISALLTRVEPSIKQHYFFGQVVTVASLVFLLGSGIISFAIAQEISADAALFAGFELVVWVVTYALVYFFAPSAAQ